MNYNRFRSHSFIAAGIAFIAVLFLFCACSADKDVSVEATAPAATPEETLSPISFTVELTPVPTVTPEPTPEPTPTPTPAPTMDPESDAAKNLMMDWEEIRLIANKRGTRVYEEPSKDAKVYGIRNAETDSAKSEFIVLDELTADDGTPFYYVAAAFNGERGYLPTEYEDVSELAAEGLTGYGILNRPRTPIYKSWYMTETSKKMKL